MSKKQKLQVVGSADEHKAMAGKNFSVHHLVSFKAMTDRQQEFIDAFYESETPIIVQYGSAGTGKTATALYAALHHVFDKSTVYDKVVIIRSAVQAREIGFLKGDEDEKDAVYEAPYDALLNELTTFKSTAYVNLKAQHVVEFHNTSFLRGKTFNNAIMILDEFENCTYHELATVITRMGYNTRLVMCGDHKQVDLHKRSDKTGFFKLLRILRRMDPDRAKLIKYVPEDCVRSGIAKDFLLAEEEDALEHGDD